MCNAKQLKAKILLKRGSQSPAKLNKNNYILSGLKIILI